MTKRLVLAAMLACVATSSACRVHTTAEAAPAAPSANARTPADPEGIAVPHGRSDVAALCGFCPTGKACLVCADKAACEPFGATCCKQKLCRPPFSACLACDGVMLCVRPGSTCCGDDVCAPAPDSTLPAHSSSLYSATGSSKALAARPTARAMLAM